MIIEAKGRVSSGSIIATMVAETLISVKGKVSSANEEVGRITKASEDQVNNIGDREHAQRVAQQNTANASSTSASIDDLKRLTEELMLRLNHFPID